MHIKFLSRGSGSGSGAIDYVLNDNDHTKSTRPYAPYVLRGSPETTGKLADSLGFSKKYSSAVIAFHPTDSPTDTEIQEVLDGFEKVAFSGLESDQYTYTAVLHKEKESSHIHIIIPRIELSTGKSFNPAPPGWQKDYDALRDYFNEKNDWKSPDISLNPEQARITQPALDALRRGSRSEIKKNLEKYIINEIENENINNRDDIIQSLQDIGFEIPRQGKSYITIHDTETDTRIRLKGAIYEQYWRTEQTLKTENRSEAERDRDFDTARATAAYNALEARISKRTEYNQKRYKRPERRFTQDSFRDKKQKSGSSKRNQEKVDADMVKDDPNSNISLDSHLREQLGADAILSNRDRASTNSNQNKPRNDRKTREKQRLDSVRDMRQETLRENRDELSHLRRWLQGFKEKITICLNTNHDRTRDYISECTRKIINSIQGGHDKNRETDQHFSATSEQLREAKQNTDRALQPDSINVEKGVRAVRANNDNELEQFKTKINLVEYIASQCYTLDKKESTKNSKTMRKGDDKLVITTDTDSHGIYFSARDSSDNGSIIDFIQNRENKNLGEVRKELRSFDGFTDIQDYKSYSKPTQSSKDTAQATYMLAKAQFTNSHPYLLDERKISSETLTDPRFNNIKIDARGNALFPHYNSSGASGYEIKNKDFTGFAKGGEKGIWYTSNIMRAKNVVICESAIDALSHAELKNTSKETAYISVGGSISASQLELIKTIGKDRQIIIATDNDETGSRYAKQIKELAPNALREVAQHKDWNDDLKHKYCDQDRGLEM